MPRFQGCLSAHGNERCIFGYNLKLCASEQELARSKWNPFLRIPNTYPMISYIADKVILKPTNFPTNQPFVAELLIHASAAGEVQVLKSKKWSTIIHRIIIPSAMRLQPSRTIRSCVRGIPFIASSMRALTCHVKALASSTPLTSSNMCLGESFESCPLMSFFDDHAQLRTAFPTILCITRFWTISTGTSMQPLWPSFFWTVSCKELPRSVKAWKLNHLAKPPQILTCLYYRSIS